MDQRLERAILNGRPRRHYCVDLVARPAVSRAKLQRILCTEFSHGVFHSQALFCAAGDDRLVRLSSCGRLSLLALLHVSRPAPEAAAWSENWFPRCEDVAARFEKYRRAIASGETALVCRALIC